MRGLDKGNTMKRKLMLCASIAGSLLFGMAGTASAEGVVSGRVTFASDYLFRGITQTSNNPAIQGSLDYTNGIWYAGVWGSNIDFGLDETIEIDGYFGVRPTWGPVTFDFGVIGYFYPGSTDFFGEYDYFEGKAGASFAATEALTLGATLYYSPEFTFETGESLYTEFTGAYAITDTVKISGGYGIQEIDEIDGYDTWNLGVGFSAAGLDFDARYTDTDISGLDDVFSVSVGRGF